MENFITIENYKVKLSEDFVNFLIEKYRNSEVAKDENFRDVLTFNGKNIYIYRDRTTFGEQTYYYTERAKFVLNAYHTNTSSEKYVAEYQKKAIAEAITILKDYIEL